MAPGLRSIAYGASPITTTKLKAVLKTFRCRLFSGGENVYPIEVEEALASHADVAEVP